ncbi:YeiH family protein [Parerythrobacter jejuensis]|uniref:Putative sulfate exporter family transporter n=1 Tax=Parerythrobacter jejuensis TaxID=795812 RepID=A0A845B2D7_9SPHN|nr:putative sulfate exporter family transporter [Parerythrobacter jejuensis]MXP30378.1 putative sulfate exporter family transporter [Parerythrobacter jejuensis]MXP33138.1 putative sulfate exporter family transporter [Parerythrobacter jejuensis]
MAKTGPETYWMADLYGELQLAEPAPRRSLVSYLPGLGLVLVASLAALWLSEHYGPPAVLMGLLIGLALNFTNSDTRLSPGLDFASQTLLRIGIVLIGLRITWAEIAGLGVQPFLYLVMIMAGVIAAGLLAARLLRQDLAFGLLAGGATAICGASAALALWSLLGEKRVSSERFTIVLLGTTIASAAAMTFYPAIAGFLGLSDQQAGFLIGASIHDVAQAIGGGFAYSDPAGEVAAVVKLSRVAMLVPILLLVSFVIARSDKDADGDVAEKLTLARALPWFIVGFILLVAINSLVALPDVVTKTGAEAASLFLLFAVTAAAIKSNLGGLLAHSLRSFGPVIITTLTAFLLALLATQML